MGILLAVGLAVRSSSRLVRALSAASLPVLAASMYFTFSRGAWGALAVGFAAALALGPRRLQLVAGAAVLAPWSLAALVLADRSTGLTTRGATLGQAIDDGHALVLPILGLTLASGLAALAFAVAEGAVLQAPKRVRVGFAILVAVAVAVAVAVLWSAHGAPLEGRRPRLVRRFTASPQRGTATNVSAAALSSSRTTDGWISGARPGRLPSRRSRVDGQRRGHLLGSCRAAERRPGTIDTRQKGDSLYAETMRGEHPTGRAWGCFWWRCSPRRSPRRSGHGAPSRPLSPARASAYVAFLAARRPRLGLGAGGCRLPSRCLQAWRSP